MTDSTFKELQLSDEILRAITEMGFEAPTAIQEECIPKILNGTDLVGQAQTGTGKTAAFGIPMVEKIDTNSKNVQALIQCPTRELAIQVTGELIKLGKFVGGLKVVPVYGGQSIGQQIKAIKRGAQIVVGTPGRTIDHLQRGTLKIDQLEMLVFDEADEMLNMGFRNDMEKILSYTNGPIQTVMFSATVPRAIRDIMKRYMEKPQTVTIQRKAVTAPNIEQYLVEVRDSVRTEAICRFLDINDFKLALVFCNTKRKTESLTNELISRGYGCDYINGDLSQNQRDRVMDKYRKKQIDVLVATDVAARGIDVDDVDVVFNYDVPQDPEYYVHRIGRTGRAGRSGKAITFTTRRKNKQLRTIERQIKTKLDYLDMPSNSEVRESRLSSQMDEVVETLEKGGLKDWIEQIESFSDKRFTTVEIAAALLKLKSGEMEEEKDNNSFAKNNKVEFNDNSMVKLFFSVGKQSKVYPGDLVGAIAGETGIPGNVIGNIDIRRSHSFVDIPGNYAGQVIKGMHKNQVKGRKVKVKVA
ncbi:DEAD/DEAH box helicase [Aliifodinibius sp. S!AR15-10]|uniref:DEAD/DEAH box helicase n=1 Tax=Aliifodinibius sp. S!AR15-10 TaxID=2950437 RepID=UPI0028614404|nr:DEAD/DEAH box helicase [Aliifodinibius sp. S!AR15-10]MDR8391419.1 DEAD/DEAH box helicase [Aliifodinibius sp. S!AR15-10]